MNKFKFLSSHSKKLKCQWENLNDSTGVLRKVQNKTYILMKLERIKVFLKNMGPLTDSITLRYEWKCHFKFSTLKNHIILVL